jgi:hypothetical protein
MTRKNIKAQIEEWNRRRCSYKKYSTPLSEELSSGSKDCRHDGGMGCRAGDSGGSQDTKHGKQNQCYAMCQPLCGGIHHTNHHYVFKCKLICASTKA